MSTEAPSHAAQTIEDLTARYQRLNEQKIQAQRDLQHAQNRLDELKTKAMREYGTNDLEELRQLLENMKRQNEEDRTAYQASLDEIETELGNIERRYQSVEQDRDQLRS